MALLETYPVGTTVKIAENGTLAEYLIVHIGLPDSMYDVSCDGIWMLRKDIFEKRQWHSSLYNDYKNSTIFNYLNSSFSKLFDDSLNALVKAVKIPYVAGAGNTVVQSGADGLPAQFFLLSGRELGFTINDSDWLPVDGQKLPFFDSKSKRIATFNGTPSFWWSRSPSTGSNSNVFGIRQDGSCNHGGCTGNYGVRPAFILPYNLIRVNDDGTLNLSSPVTLGELGLKDKVTFGAYYDAPIVWDVGDKNHVGYPDNSVTLVAERLLKLAAFDAKEPNNNNSDRRSYGNNRYALSNIRQWLNSDAPAGQWYAAQHSADAPPSNDNVDRGYNEYDCLLYTSDAADE